ncbi:MAG: PadR family transcriptional regulator [Eubacteriales bacterium]|mgnify:CR=1 FL=1|nr:PadR family transcriptional regulator [Eubacteriales bacterium]MDD3573234.1 PadR family transcriptional regulator [Eubacteriales bacterium]MDD4135369.1 PadR family transcriptional regulator [Eubacteriales bacterium]NLV59955.1 PadR family transcriptional regulator [Clostridiales bacterium]
MDGKQAHGQKSGRKAADKFLEACLLQLLSEGTGHGYVLMEQLGQFGISADALNISTLYRTLRHMEKDGCLKSEWEEGGPGPKRRVYLISEKGKKELEIRIQMIKARKSGIDRLIGAYGRSQEQAVQTDRPGTKEEML